MHTCQLTTKLLIALVRDQRISARSKHIGIHYHFVRDYYNQKLFNIAHVSSNDNIADICTKALPLPLLAHFTKLLFAKPIDMSTSEEY